MFLNWRLIGRDVSWVRLHIIPGRLKPEIFLFAAPLCPKPPDTPGEGKKDFYPKAIGLEPHKLCAVNSEDVEIKCHSFLSIFIQRFSYGRNSTKGKELCDGEKTRDSKAPVMNCYNETFETGVVAELKSLCHGDFTCSYNIPTVPLDPICDGLKREARIEFSCGMFDLSR